MRRLTQVEKQIREVCRTAAGRRQMAALASELMIISRMQAVLDRKKLSLAKVARKMKTSPAHLLKILGFEVSPTLVTLQKFAWATGTKLAIGFVLVSGEGKGDVIASGEKAGLCPVCWTSSGHRANCPEDRDGR